MGGSPKLCLSCELANVGCSNAHVSYYFNQSVPPRPANSGEPETYSSRYISAWAGRSRQGNCNSPPQTYEQLFTWTYKHMNIRAYVNFVKMILDLLTYPAVCALPLDPLPWYNRYVKRERRENMKNTQTTILEQTFVRTDVRPLVKCAASSYRRFSHNSPGFYNCQAKNLYRLLKNITRYNKI